MKAAWVSIVLVGLTCAAQAQTTSLDCVPPLLPDTQASAGLLRDFEPEIRAEFSAYFDAAQTYIRCLDAASQAAKDQVQEVLDAHRRLFPEG